MHFRGWNFLKLVPESLFTDAYMRHEGEMSWFTEVEWCTYYVSVNQAITDLDNALLPMLGLLLIWHFATNFSEIRIKIQKFSCKKMDMKMSSAKYQPFCSGLNQLTQVEFKYHSRTKLKFGICAQHTLHFKAMDSMFTVDVSTKFKRLPRQSLKGYDFESFQRSTL